MYVNAKNAREGMLDPRETNTIMSPQLDFLPGIVGEQNNLTFSFTVNPFAPVLPTASISLYLPGVNFTSESSIEVDGCGHTK